MSSLSCWLRHNVIDQNWTYIAFPIALIALFSHKQRIIATLFAYVFVQMLLKSMGCMGGANILVHLIVIYPLVLITFVPLFILSFINMGNIYLTYVINTVALALVYLVAPFIFSWMHGTPSKEEQDRMPKIVAIGGVKPQAEVQEMLSKAIVPIRT